MSIKIISIEWKGFTFNLLWIASSKSCSRLWNTGYWIFQWIYINTAIHTSMHGTFRTFCDPATMTHPSKDFHCIWPTQPTCRVSATAHTFRRSPSHSQSSAYVCVYSPYCQMILLCLRKEIFIVTLWNKGSLLSVKKIQIKTNLQYKHSKILGHGAYRCRSEFTEHGDLNPFCPVDSLK